MINNKKILIATGIFPPDIGGPAIYVETLLNELPKHGFNVKVVTYSDSVESGIRYQESESFCEKGNVVRISRTQKKNLRYWKYFLAIWKLISWADVVYLQDPISAGIPTSLICRLRRKKYFLKIVGDYAWEKGQQKYGVTDLLDEFQDKGYGYQVGLIRLLQRWVARGAKKIITPSHFLKKIILKWGIQDEKIQVIYNSVRKAYVLEDKEILRRKLNLSGNVIISVARLVPWKGFEALIEIMSELIKINSEFKLLIAGSGPEYGKYEKKIKDLRLSGNIKLLGGLEQKKLWDYMKASDFFVLNTGYEGLPHLVIEAMYLELPVITTNIGGNPEVVRAGENGLLVEYNNKLQIKNAILEIWKNGDARQEMIDNGKKGLEKFSTEKMVEGLINQLKIENL